MSRVLDRWWVLGAVLVAAVLVLARAFYVAEAAQHQAQERATQRQVGTLLADDVQDVLRREVALAGVVRAVGLPPESRWAALANIVTSQPAATGAGFIVPVLNRDRRAFERRTGLNLVESPQPGGVIRPAGDRTLHLVSVDSWSKTTKPVLGLDVAADALRRGLLLKAAATGEQLATPPTVLLGPAARRFGVVAYFPVRETDGRLEGWVTASYQASQLAKTVALAIPGVHVTVHDGSIPLLTGDRALAGTPVTINVAGRQWMVWASRPGSATSVIPWLVLGFGLALAGAVTLIVRQAASRERYAARRLSEHDAEEAALHRIATAVAQGDAPQEVFSLVAKEVGTLLNARTAAVSRFVASESHGILLGSWTPEGEELTNAVFSLDGVSASAAVYRTGAAARTEASYASEIDPIAPMMDRLGGTRGIAAPILVAGQLWGALGTAYGDEISPAGIEQRLERFGRLVGLAISNAAAREELDQQASTDSLTGIANRRVFDERLRSELARVRRRSMQLSVAMIDLDHFKQVNDKHGHAAGDRVLIGFAALLGAHARQEDLVARVGGEEFAWLMPDTDEHEARAAAERLRKHIQLEEQEHGSPITVSAGVVTADELSTPDSLLSKADLALYKAKHRGRNAVVLAGENDHLAVGA